MYNRYIRNDQGTYTRIPEEEPRHTGAAPPLPVSRNTRHPAAGSSPPIGTAPPRPALILPPPARMGRTASAACSGICWTSFT
ncbi:MAG: hypothetical protein EP146_15410 [Oscillibacter sp.]|uniref:hypothetical protein n=1 Tax=Oscillibacter sp. TaxID=1945593 RepID=UPI001322C871|nr:hypothetical protein [Oscillibacter sp.]MUU12702.1 hypothetical protein [Oscillibacter sp.]